MSYGVFAALHGVAALCNPPGDLVRDDGEPLTLDDLTDATGIEAELLDEAIGVLIAKPIEWIQIVSADRSTTAPSPQSRRGVQERREQERTGEESSPGAGARGASEASDKPIPPLTRSGYPEVPRTYRGMPEYPIDPGFEPDAQGRAYATTRGLKPEQVRDRLRNAASAKAWVRADWQAAYREECDKLIEWRERDGKSPDAGRVTPDRNENAARLAEMRRRRAEQEATRKAKTTDGKHAK